MTSASHREEAGPSPRGRAPKRPLVFDRRSIQAVDREAIERYGIPGIVLMENASRGLAGHVLARLPDGTAAPVLICCGAGNNGGDGYALARHLHNRGARPVIAALGEPAPGGDAAINAEICRRMGLERRDELPGRGEPEPALIVDGLFGTGLDRPVRGRAEGWIEWMNDRESPVVAIDVPSGLDCDTGRPLGAAVRAALTVTFVGLKRGFLDFEAQKYVGDVVIVDIGAPVELYEAHGRPAPAAPRYLGDP